MKYVTVEHLTTKKKNHLLSVPADTFSMLLTKGGEIVPPITESKFKNKKAYVTKPGRFLFLELDNKIFLLQFIKILRECDRDVPIRELEPSEVHYKGLWCVLNVYDGEWNVPLIDRIKHHNDKIENYWRDKYDR